ncbi:MAG: phosphoribosylglycinamide formyltransferase [Proteobacteria bacterium]|nr:phosphoribosylglycinamide formyltransferase [Pseudomonadota bacterium]
MTKKINIAILISGTGSNMQALVDACNSPNFPACVAVVIANKSTSAGLAWAKENGIATVLIDQQKFALQENPKLAFEQELQNVLQNFAVELICLAGFMRLLSGFFVAKWSQKIINIHPSLLPNFKGANAVFDALQAKATITGCTTHFVVEEMDAGPIILQQKVPIDQADNLESLKAKILQQEHQIYPQTLKIVCNQILAKIK